jgi:hypothetical protein
VKQRGWKYRNRRGYFVSWFGYIAVHMENNSPTNILAATAHRKGVPGR